MYAHLQLNRHLQRVGSLLLLFSSIVLFQALLPPPCTAQSGCSPDYRRSGTQPYPADIAVLLDRAATNRLGSAAPALPPIFVGNPPNQQIGAYVPCVLLKAIAAVETAQTEERAEFNGWKQFNANYGQFGTTVVNPDPGACGYGLMQLTDGMNDGRPFPIGTIDPIRVASEPAYNAGAAAKLLIHKWNTIPHIIGSNDPTIIEHWYFAVWAYNGFSFVNNPTNRRFNAGRAEWKCGQAIGQRHEEWPYQELVWGCVGNPPEYPVGTPLWPRQPLAFPVREQMTDPPPTFLPWTFPEHRSCTVIRLLVIR